MWAKLVDEAVDYLEDLIVCDKKNCAGEKKVCVGCACGCHW